MIQKMNIDKHLDKNGLSAGDYCTADAANIAEQIQRRGLDDFKKELHNLESDQKIK